MLKKIFPGHFSNNKAIINPRTVFIQRQARVMTSVDHGLLCLDQPTSDQHAKSTTAIY